MSTLTYKDAPKPLRRAAKALFKRDREELGAEVYWKYLDTHSRDYYTQLADLAVAEYADGTRKTFERMVRDEWQQVYIFDADEFDALIAQFEDIYWVDTDRFSRGWDSASRFLIRKIKEIRL